jgi:hypothetical protein
MIRNGVLGEKARMEISYSSLNSLPIAFSLYLNDRFIETININPPPGQQGTFFGRACIEFDPLVLRFGSFESRAYDAPRMDGRNFLRIVPQGPVRDANRGESRWAAISVRWVSLEAMSPIFLVHGIFSDSSAFAKSPQVIHPTPLQSFTRGLENRLAPFVGLGNELVIGANDERFRKFAPAATAEYGSRINSEINYQRGRFGADLCHVVGHSKGGLGARYARAIGDNLSPIWTLHTLNSPMAGAPLGEIVAFVGTIAEFAKGGEVTPRRISEALRRLAETAASRGTGNSTDRQWTQDLSASAQRQIWAQIKDPFYTKLFSFETQTVKELRAYSYAAETPSFPASITRVFVSRIHADPLNAEFERLLPLPAVAPSVQGTVMYYLTGGLADVELRRSNPTQGGLRFWILTEAAAWFLVPNDLVVTTKSSLWTSQGTRAIYSGNHSSTVASERAQLIFERIRAIEESPLP